MYTAPPCRDFCAAGCGCSPMFDSETFEVTKYCEACSDPNVILMRRRDRNRKILPARDLAKKLGVSLEAAEKYRPVAEAFLATKADRIAELNKQRAVAARLAAADYRTATEGQTPGA